MGVRIEKRGDKKENEGEKMVEIKGRLWEDWWKIVGVYVNNDLEKKLNKLKKWTKKRVQNTKVLIGGNFIARMRGKESRVKGLNEEEEIEEKQKTKDSKVNREVRTLCKFLADQGGQL